MTRIAIGVYVYAQPQRLRATLASIERNTTLDHDLVVLPGGAGDEACRDPASLLAREERRRVSTEHLDLALQRGYLRTGAV